MDKQSIIKEVMDRVREAYKQAHVLEIDVAFLADLQDIENSYINSI